MMVRATASSCTQSVIVNCTANLAVATTASRRRRLEGLSRVSWKLSRTVLRGAVGGNADCLLDKDMPKGQKKPKYEFAVPGREPFGMAGLWKFWKNPATELWERTFAILTGDVNSIMQPIHDRQPIILEPREYGEYLIAADRPPTHLVRVLPDEELKARLLTEDKITQQQASLFDSH
jgi:hypothetical protein